MPCKRLRLVRGRVVYVDQPCEPHGKAYWQLQPPARLSNVRTWHRLVAPVSLLLRDLRPVRAALHGRILVWPACKKHKDLPQHSRVTACDSQRLEGIEKAERNVLSLRMHAQGTAWRQQSQQHRCYICIFFAKLLLRSFHDILAMFAQTKGSAIHIN